MSADIATLAARAAERLAGKPVLLRWQMPYLAGALGAAFIDKQTGRAVIDIKPGLPDADMLYTLCHEAAHHRLNHAPAGNYLNWQPGGIDNPRLAAALGARPVESDADNLARQWLSYCERRPTLPEKLVVLSLWPVDVDCMIDNAVRNALAHYGLRR